MLIGFNKLHSKLKYNEILAPTFENVVPSLRCCFGFPHTVGIRYYWFYLELQLLSDTSFNVSPRSSPTPHTLSHNDGSLHQATDPPVVCGLCQTTTLLLRSHSFAISVAAVNRLRSELAPWKPQNEIRHDVASHQHPSCRPRFRHFLHRHAIQKLKIIISRQLLRSTREGVSSMGTWQFTFDERYESKGS